MIASAQEIDTGRCRVPRYSDRAIRALACRLRRDDATQPHLMRPRLPEQLVDVATRAGAVSFGVRRIGEMNEVLAVEQSRHHVLTAAAGNRFAPIRKIRITHVAGHRSAGLHRCEIHRCEPGDLAVPRCVERVVLRAIENAILICITRKHEFNGLAPHAARCCAGSHHPCTSDARGTHAGWCRTVHRLPVRRSRDSRSGRIPRGTRPEINQFASRSFKAGEDPQAMHILPHMRAGARTAVRSFPSVEPAVVKPPARCSRGGRDRHKGPVQQPVGEREVVRVSRHRLVMCMSCVRFKIVRERPRHRHCQSAWHTSV